MERLDWKDFLTIGIYFAVVLFVGIWVGASIFASNIGAPMFIGEAGAAAASGIAIVIYEWIAVYFLIMLGWLFVPVYTSCGAYTTPEYLRKRFGGKRIRIYSSVFALVGFILFNISIEMYAGGIFLKQLLGWNLYLSVVIILSVTAIYTIIGGLASVMYTDTLQTVILLTGSVVLFFMSYMGIGGWEGLRDKYMSSASNTTLSNTSFYACGMPRKDSFTILRNPVSGDIPWTGSTFGLSTLGLYVWCHDQLIVQRTLSAKNLSHAKAGSLLGSCLKILPFILFVIPGMISRVLFPDEIACSDPASCYEFCENPAGCSNMAYPLLVVRVLPAGVRGLMLAALLAALMSSLTSILNSASSIVTLDIWRLIRPHASIKELMVVGRVTIIILVVSSILWLPILEMVQGGQFWSYMQAIRSYLIPPWCMLFMLGVFTTRTTEAGGFWGLIIGLIVGVIRMVLDFTYPAPACGSGEEDTRPLIVTKVDFLHFAIILAGITTAAMLIISYFTTPRPKRKLHRVTWWTRHDIMEQDLDSDEEIDDISDDNDKEDSPSLNPMELDEVHHEGLSKKTYNACVSWVCGYTDENSQAHASTKELPRKWKDTTSIKENKYVKRSLDIIAIIIALGTTVLIGYFN